MKVWVVEALSEQSQFNPEGEQVWTPVLNFFNPNISGVWRTRKFAREAKNEMTLRNPFDVKYRVVKYVREGGNHD